MTTPVPSLTIDLGPVASLNRGKPSIADSAGPLSAACSRQNLAQRSSGALFGNAGGTYLSNLRGRKCRNATLVLLDGSRVVLEQTDGRYCERRRISTVTHQDRRHRGQGGASASTARMPWVTWSPSSSTGTSRVARRKPPPPQQTRALRGGFSRKSGSRAA